MDSKIINRVLMVIFLVLTVFFFVLYSKDLKRKSQLSDDFVLDAVSNLQNSGIDISQNVIRNDIPHMNIYAFESVNADKQVDVVSGLLCDKLYDSSVTTAKFETPEGVSVGIYGGEDGYEIAKIVFDTNKSTFRFVKNRK